MAACSAISRAAFEAWCHLWGAILFCGGGFCFALIGWLGDRSYRFGNQSGRGVANIASWFRRIQSFHTGLGNQVKQLRIGHVDARHMGLRRYQNQSAIRDGVSGIASLCWSRILADFKWLAHLSSSNQIMILKSDTQRETHCQQFPIQYLASSTGIQLFQIIDLPCLRISHHQSTLHQPPLHSELLKMLDPRSFNTLQEWCKYSYWYKTLNDTLNKNPKSFFLHSAGKS